MPDLLLIAGGTVIDPANGIDAERDVLIADGVIRAVAEAGSLRRDAKGAEVIEAAGCWVTPGLVDMHVHLREPGYEYRETVATGADAAVAGGFTSVACMANTKPVNDNAAVTEYILDRARMARKAHVFPIGAVSVGLAGKQLAEIGEMRRAGTNVDPYKPSTTIVEAGPYRYTRNPLYVGMTLMYGGFSALANALPSVLLLPGVLAVMRRGVIEREERYLEGKFGDEYRAYKARVRRWI